MSDTAPTGSADLRTRATGPWAELLRDQRQRWQQGECPPVEHYLAQEPRLDEYPETLADLIRAEMVLRRERGADPSLDEYLQRFPHHAAHLRQRFNPGPQPQPADAPAFDSFPSMGGLLARLHPEQTPSNPPQVPGYEILEEVGRGGMGIVYKARHLQLNRIVALKMILVGLDTANEERARFRAEAETIARLQHPNIVQVFEVGEAAGRPYLALEFVSGGSLTALRGAALQPTRWVAQLLAILARAVHHCHQRGIIHRDLKPANILFQFCEETAPTDSHVLHRSEWPARIPKITDFGLAKRLDAVAEQTRTGMVMGTPSFMAPEQAAGQAIGPAADVYALGAILYDLLTGRPPFQGDSVLAVLEQVRNDEPVAPTRLNPKVPRDLETICLRCLEKAPHARYATAEALGDDLQRFLNDEPILARPVSLWRFGWRWLRRRPLLASLAGVLLFVTVALTLVTLFSFYYAQRLIENQERVEHTLEVLVEQQRLASLLRDAETSQRGYLLTGDKSHLESYHQDLEHIPALLDRLVELTHDNPRQTERLMRLRAVVAERLRVLQEVIALRDQPDGLGAASAAVKAGQGRRIMMEAQALLTQIESEERELLAVRSAADEAATRRATWTLIAGVILAGALLLGLAAPLLRIFSRAPPFRR